MAKECSQKKKHFNCDVLYIEHLHHMQFWAINAGVIELLQWLHANQGAGAWKGRRWDQKKSQGVASAFSWQMTIFSLSAGIGDLWTFFSSTIETSHCA